MNDFDPAQVQQLMNSLNLTSAQAEDVARSLNRLGQATRGQATAADAQASAADRVTRSYDSLKEAGGNFRDGLVHAGSSINTLTSNVGATKEVFMALIPPLTFAHDIFAKMVTVAGGVFGATLSKLPVVNNMLLEAQKAFMASTDVIINAAKGQITETQKLVNEYKSLADSGMIFGGSMQRAGEFAHKAGISLETFSSFASKSAGNLALIGGNSQNAAGMIMTMAKRISPGLMEMYGSMDNLASEVANYAALQTGLGIDAVKNQKQLEAGAKQYLLYEKELSNLTGKKVDQLRQEEKQRQQSAAYQLKMGQLAQTDPVAYQNMRRMFDTYTSQFGELGSKYVMDLLVNNGQVMSEYSLKARNFFGAATGAMEESFQNIHMSNEEFMMQDAKIRQSRAEAIQTDVSNLQTQLNLQASGYLGQFGEFINSIARDLTTNMSPIKNAVQATAEAHAETMAAMAKGPEIVGNAIKALEALKIKLENITIENLPMVKDAIRLSELVMEPYVNALKEIRALSAVLIDPNDAVIKELLKTLGLINPQPPRRQDENRDATSQPISAAIEAAIQAYEWMKQQRDNPPPVGPERPPQPPQGNGTPISSNGINSTNNPTAPAIAMSEADVQMLTLMAEIARYSKDTADTQGRILNAQA